MPRSPAVGREAGHIAHLIAAVLFASVLGGSSALAQNAQVSGSSSSATATHPSPVAPSTAKGSQAKASPAAKPGGPASRSLPNRFAGRAGAYYKVVWGIDSLAVKWTESGEIVRFSWRVLDPALAKALSDKRAEPSLIDPQAGVSLVVPTMEKIGQLRQTSSPEVGKSYWVAFSNTGLLVKPGHRVDVAIGTFRAQGLVVD
jgi:hypothetical protein